MNNKNVIADAVDIVWAAVDGVCECRRMAANMAETAGSMEKPA